MKPSLTHVALGVSLLFNGAVLAGFAFAPPPDGNPPPREARARNRAPNEAGPRQGQRAQQPGRAAGERGPDQRGPGMRGPAGDGPGEKAFDLRRAAGLLELTDEQRALLEQLRDEHREMMKTFDEESAVVHQLLDDELAKDDVSFESIREALERRADLGRERRRAQADLFERFIDSLRPEQRRMLRDRIFAADGPGRGGPGRMGPPPEVIGRFDRDGNGRLDRDEVRGARDAFEARRDELRPRGRAGAGQGPGPGQGRGAGAGAGAGPRPEGAPGDGPGMNRPHPPLWVFFDRNGDGKLNDAEKAERDAFVQSHPPSKAWRPTAAPAE